MKKSVILCTILAALLLSLSACGSAPAAETEGPAAQPQVTASGSPEAEADTGRQNGERFEAVIMLEGMEETVQYEHLISPAAGFEMDYDYESFVHRSEPNRECFISIWDDSENPENYLEVTGSAEDAETMAASVREALSQDYDLVEESRQLEGAGSCIYIEASALKGTGRMAEQLQAVYIIPASDGCRVATAHFSCEAAEGFGRRFSYMLNTLALIDR